jgi:signal transduction histidine kinase
MVSIQYLELFRKISLQQRESLIKKQKEFIKDLIAIEVDYISRAKIRFDEGIAGELSENVCYAYSIAEQLYHDYQGKMPEKAIREMIIEAISAMKCSQAYAHVFINDLNGDGIYYSDNPDRMGVNLINCQDSEGNFVVQKELELLKKEEEGFIWYGMMNKADGKKTLGSKKVAFVKKFKPFNWYFGSKCYIDDYYEEFKKDIANKISSERFRYGGYIFLTELSGSPVVYEGKIYNGNLNYYSRDDTSKTNVFLRLLHVAQSSPEGGFVTYEWNKMDETQKSRKISYVRYFQECDWLVGAGFYEDEIDTDLIIQMNDLKSGMINKLIRFFVILLIVLGVEVIFIYRFNKSYRADFSHFADFFQRGKGKYEKINIDRLHFSEFRKMGVIANEMIEERARIHEKLVQEQKKVLESDRLKTAFLANMSHEIRTPMNAIIGFSQLLDDESISREDRKTFLQLILQNGELLMNLINDIIDIAKIESGQLNIVKREFKLSSLLDNITIYYQEYISGNSKMKIQFQMEKNIPDHFMCYTDQFRLKQVLDNLIGNAIKFTSVGAVKLIVSENNGKVYFQVMDTGIGISEEDQRLIFDRFIQAKDHVWKNYGGTGLGLAISKNIVELLGGEIGVRSAPGKGSEFYFYIPGCEGKPEV